MLPNVTPEIVLAASFDTAIAAVALILLLLTTPAERVVASATFAPPLNDTADAVTSPVILKFLELCSVVAVVEFPDSSPENVVEESVPADGLYVNFVLETFCGRSPVFAVTKVR